MIDDLCPMEASVLVARRTGQFTEALERHIADCLNCQELLKVAGFMNRIADNLRRDPALPDPALVWLKAQWIEREERQRRYLARTALRRTLMQAGVMLILLLIVMGIWSGAALSTEATTSVDEVIFFTLVGTFAMLFLGGVFMVSRWRGLLVS
jgi:predicted anti-sigma-YlaC factor YlaD